MRLRDWCAGLAFSASVDFVGAGQVAAFERLDVNHAALSAAPAFRLHTPGEEATRLTMAADLWLYWEARGHLGEGRRWRSPSADRLLRAAAARYRDADDRREAFCWADIGSLPCSTVVARRPAEAFERSLDLDQGGDPWTTGAGSRSASARSAGSPPRSRTGTAPPG